MENFLKCFEFDTLVDMFV